MNDRTILERAFVLARSGRCESLNDVREILSREGYSNVDAHLTGGVIRKQLTALLEASGDTFPPEETDPAP